MSKNERFYLSTHEWVEFTTEGTALIGISDYAQLQLGDIVFVNLPDAGDIISIGARFADVESVKGVSDVLSPVSGIITRINEELLDSPQLINEDAEGTWLIEVSEISDRGELLSSSAYAAISTC